MTASANKPAEDLVGQVLGERYRVEQRLSQGGMGVVYQARHVVLDSQLAVKVLIKPQGPEDQRRFLQEAKLASLIQHPNTVQIIDFGVLPSGKSYLVMELLRGRTLATEIMKGPMEALRVCRIGTQIARGLQAVHDQGIVHRDMKPDKVRHERAGRGIIPPAPLPRAEWSGLFLHDGLKDPLGPAQRNLLGGGALSQGGAG